ncbi:MAG: hypothetical protein V1936_01655 [Patescibacteria group bacterium]
MQNPNLANALEDLLKKNVRAEKLSKKLKLLSKKLEAQKPKKILVERTKKAELVNLKISAELRKKMDAVPQKINTND